MKNFEYCCPTEIIFGVGAENCVAEKIRKHGGKNVLILYGGGSAVKSGLIAKIERLLTDDGFAPKIVGGVQPNPRVNFARKVIRQAIDAKIDFIFTIEGSF